MTYADFEEALVAAGQQHLVLKMEEYTAQEAEELIRGGMGRVAAHVSAETTLAGHIEGWLSGRYGEFTPAAIFEHRPLLAQAWALAEAIGEHCGRIVTGILPRQS